MKGRSQVSRWRHGPASRPTTRQPRWRVADATTLAPRASLVRISAGRDTADAAFLSVYGGAAQLVSVDVTATVSGPLPTDDVTTLMSIG